jgi:hypothetical protein
MKIIEILVFIIALELERLLLMENYQSGKIAGIHVVNENSDPKEKGCPSGQPLST